MTAYNREKYISESIESVLASTYTNFELIIVDDASRDRTVGIAKNYAAKDARIKIFVNDINLGDYPNRNKAASYATGKYIKYVDADDLIYPWGLAILVDCMERFPGVGWGLCSLDQDINNIFPFQLSPAEAYHYHYLGPGLFHKAPLSSIIKKQVFDEAGGFGNIRMAGDNEMWHRLAQKYPVLLMCQGIVWYRKHDSQEINDLKKYLLVYDKIKFKYLRDNDCPLDKTTAEALLGKYKLEIKKHIILSVAKMNFDDIKRNVTLLKFVTRSKLKTRD